MKLEELRKLSTEELQKKIDDYVTEKNIDVIDRIDRERWKR